MSITFLVLGAVVVLFVWNRLPVELVAVGASLTLYASGVLELPQILAGFGDPAVILIASLFVVSEALDATGVTTWAGQALIGRAGDRRRLLMVYVLVLVAGLTALISVNGAVASLVPMVVVVALRTGTPPSQMLMPLAFGAHAGSMLALTGTPVNVIVSDAAVDAGARAFGFFEFALVGAPLVAGTIAVVVLLGPRLLPKVTPKSMPPDLSAHARTLGLQYLSDHRVFRLTVGPESGWAGKGWAGEGLEADPDLQVIGVQVGGKGPLVHPERIVPGDVLSMRGEAGAVAGLAQAQGLVLEPDPLLWTGGASSSTATWVRPRW